jgi:hypothetical protein
MRQQKNLTGQRFGKLVAEYPTDKRSGSSIKWHCKCDCGNSCEISSYSLTSGNTKSCGCLAKESCERARAIAKEENKKRMKEGTDVARISSDRISKNNKSGCTGVCYDSHARSWKAYISFKGKRYRLGYYKNLNDAISVRKTAENRLYGTFLEWYKENYPEQWEKINKKK